MKMWSGRFQQASDVGFEQWQRSLPFDQRLLRHEVAASKAHAAALCDANVLSQAELETITGGLEQVLSEGVAGRDEPSIEDVHHFVESRLAQIVGEAGYKLHTGRSRNEQVATDLRLYVREQVDLTSDLVAEFVAVLLARAEESGDAAMPSYTHLQRAEPVLVAHWLLAYAEMFFRDLGRLADCRKRLNECPLGSGAVAGAILPLDRRKMAAALHFDRPSANSMDATADRDFAIEFVHALAVLALHLSRWAEEMVLFSTQEYGFLSLPERFSTGSSAMPQKQNPDACELIRAKAARILASAITLPVAVKGLALAYNKDLQETQEPVFESAEQCVAMLRVAGGFMSAVTFNQARMQQAASTGCMNALAAAAHLVKAGVPFRRAHEVVGGAVRLCLQKNCELHELAPEDWKQFGIEFTSGLAAALRLEAVLGSRDLEGGTAPGQVRKALVRARERLTAARGVAPVSA